MLRKGREKHRQAEALLEITERAMVASISMMISSRLLRGESLAGLEPQLVHLVLVPYIGPTAARRLSEPQEGESFPRRSLRRPMAPMVATAEHAFTFGTLGKGMPRLSRKNQVTIPVEVLREAGLEAGDSLHVRAVGRGQIEIEGIADLIDRFAGSMAPHTYPPGYLDELRDECER